jgi:acyl-CoA thioesterase FadM
LKYELYNAKTDVLCVKGESTQMAYNIAASESCFVCPPVFIKKIDEWIKR